MPRGGNRPKRSAPEDMAGPSTPVPKQRRRAPTGVESSQSSAWCPLPMYSDCGDAVYICEYCAATFWSSERLSSSSANHHKYNHCCHSGAVSFPPPPEPPQVLRELLYQRSFMEKIRAYNNMFAMTSLGASVDETINDGHGPYVFKISGQISHWIGSLSPPVGEKPRFL